MSRKCFVLSVLFAFCVGQPAFSHGVPIDISAQTDGTLATEHDVYETELNLVAGTVLTTTLPGFGVKTTEQGVVAGTDLELVVLSPLLYWDGGALAPTAAQLLLENPSGDASYTILGDSPEQTGMIWGQYNGDTGWHAHGDYTLEPVDAAPGAYGLVLQMRAEGYQPSPPFLLALNHGLQEAEFTSGVSALYSQVPEPSAALLAASGMLLLVRRRK